MKKNAKKNAKKDNNLIVSIVVVLLIIAVIVGGTFAWWTWTSVENTTVTFTVSGGSMTVDGGGNITGKNIVPTENCDGTYAIVRPVTVTAVNETATSMTATVNLDLSGVPAELKTTNFKYYISETEGCSLSATGSLDSDTKEIITFTAPSAKTTEKTYYLYIWLDSTEDSSTTQGKSFEITYTGALVQNES